MVECFTVYFEYSGSTVGDIFLKKRKLKYHIQDSLHQPTLITWKTFWENVLWKDERKKNNIRSRTKALKDTNIQKFHPSDVRHWSAGSWNNWLKLLQLNIAAIRFREVTAFTFWHWWFGYGATFLLEYMQSSFKNLCFMFILAPFDLC